eukprot:3659208-Prymnesium_polylepis.1
MLARISEKRGGADQLSGCESSDDSSSRGSARRSVLSSEEETEDESAAGEPAPAAMQDNIENELDDLSGTELDDDLTTQHLAKQ